MPTIGVDLEGVYEVQLVVNDGEDSSPPDTMLITVDNNPPVANAGIDQSASLGQTVMLDGSGSSDPDGHPIAYTWTLLSVPPGSAASISDPAVSMPSITVDLKGVYEIQLVVNDGFENSLPDTMIITVGNTPPVANAGPDQNAGLGQTVSLDGSGSSDADEDPLTYAWALISAPPTSTAAISDPSVAAPTIDVDMKGAYEIQLVVNDGSDDSPPDTMLITVANTPPVADAGPDQTADLGQTVNLDGSGSSDADEDLLTYAWTLLSSPPSSTATISDPSVAAPTIDVDVKGVYEIQLVVNDGSESSDPDTMVITVANTPPVANAGPDQNADLGQTVNLDGSGSTDADDDPLTYQWSILSAPPTSTAAISDPSVEAPSIDVDVKGNYEIQLVVDDGTEASDPDTMTVTVANTPPVADAGPDQNADLGQTVTLDGSGSSDADEDPLTYAWTLLSSPPTSTAAISDPSAPAPTIDVDVKGVYEIQLVVNDGSEDSPPDTMIITVANTPPVADAGPDQTAELGQTVTLDGSGSSDADEDPLTYAWTLLSSPPTSTAAISDTTAVAPTISVDQAGTYRIELMVHDGEQDSLPDEMLIIVGDSIFADGFESLGPGAE
jgi:uncharacterized membrane protein